MAVPVPFGPEFLVNTVTDGNQTNNDVAALANGKFVFVWEDDGPAPGEVGAGVRAQIFNADGSKFGEPIFVNAITAGRQGAPAVTGLANGNFALVWEDHSTTFSTIRGHVYAPFGDSPDLAEFEVSADPGAAHTDPALDASAGGRFLVSWTSKSVLFADTDISARAYNAASAFSTSFLVDNDAANESQPAVAGLSNGNYIVVWTDAGSAGETDGSGTHIRAEYFGGDGASRGDIGFIASSFVTSGDQIAPAVTNAGNGRFTVAYTIGPAGARDVNSETFANEGTGPQFGFAVTGTGANEGDVALAAFPGGEVVAVWRGIGTTLGDESVSHIGATYLVPLIGGGYVRETFLANQTVTNGGQTQPSIAALPDGRFVVTWDDPGMDSLAPDLSGGSVRARIFDPRTAAVNLLGRSNGDDWFGTPFDDIMDGLAGNDTLQGGAGGDRLLGGLGMNILSGGDGNDLIYGLQETDALVGGEGSDSLVGGEGTDILVGGGAADFLFGADFAPDGSFAVGSGDDNGDGGEGDDGLWGGDGGDDLNGGAGSDGMAGGTGVDTLNGGSGDDFLFGGDFSPVDGSRLDASGDDTLFGESGRDALYGFDGNDTISGDLGNEYVEAGEGADTVSGGADDDFLQGEGGDDVISGGTGFDYMYGGAGGDTFIFRKGDAADWVLDFSAAQGDKLRLEGFGPLTFAQVSALLLDFSVPGAPATVIDFIDPVTSAVDEIRLFGVAPGELNTGNLLLA